jgi:hypothetical protein
MTATPANIGSAALSAFIFHRSGLPDPVDLLGAMFVIEGLGKLKAAGWADLLQQSLGLRDDQLGFLRYHAEGDDEHFQILSTALRSGAFGDPAVTRIVKTARVVARLYALQLEELGHVCRGGGRGTPRGQPFHPWPAARPGRLRRHQFRARRGHRGGAPPAAPGRRAGGRRGACVAAPRRASRRCSPLRCFRPCAG